MLVYLSLSLSRSWSRSLAVYLFLSLSHTHTHTHTHIIVGGVDICAMLQQRLHHVQVPFLAREDKSRRALDETRKEKNAH
jgi:hypothetical protein